MAVATTDMSTPLDDLMIVTYRLTDSKHTKSAGSERSRESGVLSSFQRFVPPCLFFSPVLPPLEQKALPPCDAALYSRYNSVRLLENAVPGGFLLTLQMFSYIVRGIKLSAPHGLCSNLQFFR